MNPSIHRVARVPEVRARRRHLAGRPRQVDPELDGEADQPDLYQEMTIRNCNTVRKLADLMTAS